MISRIMGGLNTRRNSLQEKEKGFTLIELLVVVIIIGILAAIAIPIFIGVQNNAKDAAVKSDLANAKTAVIANYTDTQLAATPALDATTLGKYGFTSSGSYLTTTTPAGSPMTFAATSTSTVFCIAAKSSDTGNTYSVTSGAGVVKAVCGAATTW